MGYRNRVVGKQGENIAARFLARKGYKIIGRNIKTFVGEVDIVARKKPFIVFVEVKTRKNESFGPPYLSITEKKKRKLVQCALCYLKMKGLTDVLWRIDVISIEIKNIFWFIKKIKIERFEDVVEAEWG
ncbi:MAG: YraN family protein [Candidatus Omnitrophota bacterium]